jgi:hypothetical protein
VQDIKVQLRPATSGVRIRLELKQVRIRRELRTAELRAEQKTEISGARVHNMEDETSEDVISADIFICLPNPRPIQFLVALPMKHATIFLIFFLLCTFSLIYLPNGLEQLVIK